jgi:hypothetical protein
MKRMKLFLVATALAMLPAAAAAYAQAEAEPAPAEPCRAEPADKAMPGNGEETLSEQLDRCNGVLKPPPHADGEIEEAPPDTGRTPVIPPGQLPEQEPNPA